VVEVQKSAHLTSRVGRTEVVLVEGPGRARSSGEGVSYTGRTERNEIVHFPAPVDVTGQLVRVVIRAAYKNSLAGELCDPPPAAAHPSVRPGSSAARRSLPVVI